ncbi:ABC transporter ATP-binding protein [Streptomyces sp. T028]|uniref:ABC transporter ATP-binding protein n=1 Tax=Streptomyces sp. T028 TaxID=3394379 RepID=UPI003A8943D2
MTTADTTFTDATSSRTARTEPSRTGLPVASTVATRAFFREQTVRHRGTFARLILMNAVAVCASLAGPFLLGDVVRDLSPKGSGTSLAPVLTAFLVAVGVQALCTWQVRTDSAVLGERMLADLREDFLQRSVELPPAVLEGGGTGELLSRITTDIDRLSNAVREAVPQLIISVVWIGTLIGGLVLTAPLLALPVLVVLPPLLLTCRWYGRSAPSAYRAESASYTAICSALAESIDAARTVEAHRIGPARVARSDDRIRAWVSRQRFTMRLRTVLYVVVNSAHATLLVLVLVTGGVAVLSNRLDVGSVTTGVLLTQMLVQPLGQILRWYTDLQVAQTALSRLLGVRDIPAERIPDAAVPEGRLLDADRVRFGYQDGSDVLHDIALRVPSGTRLALVGPSGAGKSTLGRLLAGIHAPREGRITLGGTELRRLSTRMLRRHIMLVNQEHHVFSGTVRDNLLLARPTAEDAELFAALEQIQAAAWIRGLPHVLDTEVGQGGMPLTPAQAQQIALARLILADPHVLVLDEATSLLDPGAARHLEQSLARVLKGRTVISIAHRLNTAHDADLIAVIEGGRITELGDHRRLTAANGSYAALWRSWHGAGDR